MFADVEAPAPASSSSTPAAEGAGAGGFQPKKEMSSPLKMVMCLSSSIPYVIVASREGNLFIRALSAFIIVVVGFVLRMVSKQVSEWAKQAREVASLGAVDKAIYWLTV